MSEKKEPQPPVIDVVGWSKDQLIKEYLKRQRQCCELVERKSKIDKELKVIIAALDSEMVNDQEQEIQWTATSQADIECYGQPGKIVRTSRKNFTNLGTKANLQEKLSSYFKIVYNEEEDDANTRAIKCVTWLFANRDYKDSFYLKRYTIDDLEKISSKRRKKVDMIE